MIYLKTIFSAPNEIKFLKLNLQESFPYIDKFIVCEYNRTHVGSPRELIFNNFINEFSEAERQKILYIGADISAYTASSKNNSRLTHANERLIRGYFASQMSLADADIIFSVDADEIIFGSSYEQILHSLSFWTPALKLRLHQFYYRINYLWEDNVFIAPTVCYAKYYKRKYPGQWRYDGRLYPEVAGCHFSWCLTVDEMIDKLGRYSHQPEYHQFANRAVLEVAVKDRTYPFDPSVPFHIRVLDIDIDRKYYPPTLYNNLGDFTHLIEHP